MVVYIPFAIQAEIMKRLPTKSLLQFRSVSKPWKSLIDSSKFVIDYSANHTHQQHLLVCYTSLDKSGEKYVSIVDDETFPEHKLSLLPDPILAELDEAKILGSSQGLFCLCFVRRDPRDYGCLLTTAVMWNPSIRKSVVIDVPHDPIVFGFGVCPHSSNPKLVKIKFTPDNPSSDSVTFTPWQAEVYTLSSGVWRGIPIVNQPRDSIQLMWDQVVINGFIYWLAIDCISISMMTNVFEGYNLIISFDMTSEEFKQVLLPDTLARAPNRNVVISKLKKSLVVVEIVREANEKRVYGVWMMMSVPNSLTKLFTISSPDASIRAVLGFRKINNEPICAMRADYNVRDVFVHEDSEHINQTRISCYGFPHYAGSYMETLLLLDH